MCSTINGLFASLYLMHSMNRWIVGCNDVWNELVVVDLNETFLRFFGYWGSTHMMSIWCRSDPIVLTSKSCYLSDSIWTRTFVTRVLGSFLIFSLSLMHKQTVLNHIIQRCACVLRLFALHAVDFFSMWKCTVLILACWLDVRMMSILHQARSSLSSQDFFAFIS